MDKAGALKYRKIQDGMLRLFIFLTLFFPAIYGPLDYEEGGEYFVLISVPYIVLGVFLILTIINKEKKNNSKFFVGLLFLLVVYNLLSFYYNLRYLHWYGEQLNNTIAIAFFACLIRYGVFEGERGKRHIRFLMACIIVSNLCSILYFLLGYTSFVICNNHLVFYQLPEDYYEFRHYWLYSHKSDYALQLVGFLALFIKEKQLMNKKWMWWGGVCVLLISLALTHSWTSALSAGCVIFGAVLDRIKWEKITWKKQYLVGIIAAAVAAGVGGCAVWKLLTVERDLSNFGSRPSIWTGALQVIRKYPQGIGKEFSVYPIEAVGLGWQTNNAHNIFLNALLRCSVPVGICFCLLMLVILIYCIRKSRHKWLALGSWFAAILLMNMDYSLLNYEMAMFLLIMYLVCLHETSMEAVSREAKE